MGGRRVSGALNAESAASAASALGLPTPQSHRKIDHKNTQPIRNELLFPTPAKTPNRSTKTATGISAIARNLFPVRSEADELMPTPKKKGGKKYKGFTLGSFEAEEEGEPIQIYTDSHERIPEVDTSEANPFYGAQQAVPEPTKRSSKRRKIEVPGEGEFSAEVVERREDGLVYCL